MTLVELIAEMQRGLIIRNDYNPIPTTILYNYAIYKTGDEEIALDIARDHIYFNKDYFEKYKGKYNEN
ncbi:MAG: hypothetical protein ACOC3V_02725 [bacterium]